MIVYRLIHEERETAVVGAPLTPTDREYLKGEGLGVYFMGSEDGALRYLQRRRDRRFTHLLTVELGLEPKDILTLRDDYDDVCRWCQYLPRPTIFPTSETFLAYSLLHGKLGVLSHEGRGLGWDELLLYHHAQAPMTVLAIQPLPPELVGRARARKAKAKA